MKRCYVCGETKVLTDFYKNRSKSDGVTTECRVCLKAHVKKWADRNREKVRSDHRQRYRDNRTERLALRQAYHRTIAGWVSHVLGCMKANAYRRNHPEPSIDRAFLKTVTKSRKFKKMWKAWIDSGFDKWKRPSIDRLKNELTYSPSNIRLVTWRENAEAFWKSKDCFKSRRKTA